MVVNQWPFLSHHMPSAFSRNTRALFTLLRGRTHRRWKEVKRKCMYSQNLCSHEKSITEWLKSLDFLNYKAGIYNLSCWKIIHFSFTKMQSLKPPWASIFRPYLQGPCKPGLCLEAYSMELKARHRLKLRKYTKK